ncbi:hypothetical protein M426DRAFT_260681 [Hypoxylon sp. CI-4A]|nr:hypothetical protein M426DRAFT_260681 [Hypoxylon sp. CI-4A]
MPKLCAMRCTVDICLLLLPVLLRAKGKRVVISSAKHCEPSQLSNQVQVVGIKQLRGPGSFVPIAVSNGPSDAHRATEPANYGSHFLIPPGTYYRRPAVKSSQVKSGSKLLGGILQNKIIPRLALQHQKSNGDEIRFTVPIKSVKAASTFGPTGTIRVDASKL